MQEPEEPEAASVRAGTNGRRWGTTLRAGCVARLEAGAPYCKLSEQLCVVAEREGGSFSSSLSVYVCVCICVYVCMCVPLKHRRHVPGSH